MDANLAKNRKKILAKYPPEIEKIWIAADKKAKQIRNQNRKTDIKKIIIEEIKGLVTNDGVINEELVERLINRDEEGI
jgi:hypothetical protein